MPPDLREKALAIYLNNPYEFMNLMHSDLLGHFATISGAAELLSELVHDEKLDEEAMNRVIQIIVRESQLLRNVFDQVSEYEKIRRARDQPKSSDKL
jgi:light-regulated signal transduction histidine kinase (bacteriophytochrome)